MQPFADQSLFEFGHQPSGYAKPAMRVSHRQMIDHAAAPIKPTNDCANQIAIQFGDKEKVGVAFQFSFQFPRDYRNG